jgi:hypothetical protein
MGSDKFLTLWDRNILTTLMQDRSYETATNSIEGRQRGIIKMIHMSGRIDTF